jgi:hypothetical protein
MKFNQPVVTPIGTGIFQGVFGAIQRGGTEADETVALVRLKVDSETSPHLRDSNCLTPLASQSGLWIFRESELQ